MQRPLPSAAQAQGAAAGAWPTKSVKLIIPFPPGGVAEITGRPTAMAMEKILKQPIALVNRPGAGGAVAMIDPGQFQQAFYNLIRNAFQVRSMIEREAVLKIIHAGIAARPVIPPRA